MKKKLGIIAGLLFIFGLACLVFGFPQNRVQASTNGHSQSEAVQWARNQEGSTYAGNYGYQCVDLIREYYAYLGQTKPTGNANTYLQDNNGHKPSGWTINYGTAGLQPGDITVWTGGDNGHVAIAVEVYSNYCIVMQQNGDGQGYYRTEASKGHSGTQYFSGITGYIHPDFASTPEPVKGKAMSEGYDRAIPDGDYIIVSTTGWYQLDIVGDDKVAPKGQNVTIYDYTQRSQDVFTLKYNSGNKFYSITQKGTSMALDVDGASIYEGANVQMWPANTDNAQKWAISEIWDGGNSLGYRLQSAANGFSLDVAGGVAANGTNVRMWSNNNEAAQTWLFIPYKPERSIPDGKYILVSGLDDNIELDVRGDTLNVEGGVNVQIWHDNTEKYINNSLSQFNSFSVQYQGDGYYKLIHGSGLCLDVDGGGHKSMENVHLWGSNSDYAQQWAIIKQGDGYNLWARCSGMTLDVSGGDTTDGNNVRQYQWKGANSQKWKFVKAEYSVKYNANGGAGAPALQVKYYKSKLVVSNKKPANDAKDFICWNTKSDGSGKNYYPGEVYNNDADITLYARWAAHKWDNGKITKSPTAESTGIKTYTCTVCGKTKTETTPKLAKKANPLQVKVSSKTFKQPKLKKAKKFSIGVSKAQGKVTYTLNKKAKKAGIKVSKKGKVTIPKKCKKGTYKITVKAAGNQNYKAGTKTVTIKIK